MTPEGWMTEDFTRAGLVWSFGGALLAAGVGAAVGLWRGPRWGLAAALLLWGAGHAVVAVAVLGYVYADTTDVAQPPSDCVPLAGADGAARHQLRFQVPTPTGTTRGVQLPAADGACPPELTNTALLRLRTDALASSRPWVMAEPLAASQGGALIWAAFAAFGLISGTVMRRVALRAEPVAQRPPAAWRWAIGTLVGQLGLVMLAAAIIAPWFVDGSTNLALQLGLRAAATALGLFAAAGWLRGRLDGHNGLVLLGIAAVLLGFAEAARLG